MAEVEELVKAGYKEITLLGQNVNSYCKDLDTGYDFADLLRDINSFEGDFRIKFMTSHPKDATLKLFDTIAESEKVSRHIHLPFQSGSDDVLRRMNRRYTRRQYEEIIRYARSVIPDVSFTSDVIVGFPGETEQDFEQTLDLVRTVGFNGLFMFIYSVRRGTPAADMPDKIPHEISVERFKRLLELQNSVSAELNRRCIGRTVRVLTEKTDDDTLCTGRTMNDTIVRFDAGGRNIRAGQTVDVVINKAMNWALFGEIAE